MTGEGDGGRDLSLRFVLDFGWWERSRLVDSRLRGNDGGKGFVARCSCLVSGAGSARRFLDSRFRGNDGGETGTTGVGHGGKGLSLVVHAWFRGAGFWIPAFAGMTEGKTGMTGYGMGEGVCRARFSCLVSGGGSVRGLVDSRFRGNDGGRGWERGLSLAIHAWFRAAGAFVGLWIPAFAGMTGGRRE